VGDRVTLIGGAAPSPDDLAVQAGTIGYEILTSLGDRYRRDYGVG
jgi:alanine racemase